jgi:hypothetical protein
MSDTPTEHDTSPNESPTLPLPSAVETPVAPQPSSPPPQATSSAASPQPAGIAALIAGVLLIAGLTFGAGWTARGAVDHFGVAPGHGFASASAPGQRFPGGPGACADCQDLGGNQGRRPGMRGDPSGQGFRGQMGRPNRMGEWREMPSQAQTQSVPGVGWQ